MSNANHANKTLVFSAAIRGFHVYRDIWHPTERENNVFLKKIMFLTCLLSKLCMRMMEAQQLVIY